jgi:hypothetical protein
MFFDGAPQSLQAKPPGSYERRVLEDSKTQVARLAPESPIREGSREYEETAICCPYFGRYILFSGLRSNREQILSL